MYGRANFSTNNSVYTTTFPLTETPISEGGKWSRNQANPYTNIITALGRARGTNGPANIYDDSYAIYMPNVGSNYRMDATVFVDATINTTISHEVELLLKWSDDAINAFGYEANYSIVGGVQIIKWNGTFGSFTPLTDDSFSTGTIGRNFTSGDIVTALVQGTRFTQYVNGVKMFSCIDTSYTTGQPGIGAFARPDADPNSGNPKFCFEDVTITPL